MQKHAQISLWIVIGVLILVVLSVVYYKSPSFQLDRVAGASADLKAAQSAAQHLLEQCLSQAANDGVRLLGLQTGRIFVTTPSYTRFGISTPYSLGSGATPLPTLQVSKDDLERFVEQSVYLCTNKYQDMSDFNIRVNPGSLAAEVDLGESVAVVVHDTSTFSRGPSEFSLQSSAVQVAVPYIKVQAFMNDIHAIHQQYPSLIPISEIASYSYENSVTYSLFELSSTDILYEFELRGKNPYRFDYLVRLVK